MTGFVHGVPGRDRDAPDPETDPEAWQRYVTDAMHGPLVPHHDPPGHTIADRADALARAREIMPSDTDADDLVAVASWLATGHPGLLLELNDQTARNHTRTGQRLGSAEEWREGPDAATWSPDARAADLVPEAPRGYYAPRTDLEPHGALAPEGADLVDGLERVDPDPDTAGLCGAVPGADDTINVPAVVTSSALRVRTCARLEDHPPPHRSRNGATW